MKGCGRFKLGFGAQGTGKSSVASMIFGPGGFVTDRDGTKGAGFQPGVCQPCHCPCCGWQGNCCIGMYRDKARPQDKIGKGERCLRRQE